MPQKISVCVAKSEKFNSQSSELKRGSRQLKMFWESIKFCAKKQLAKEMKEIELRGGGHVSFKQDDETAAVSSFIPAKIDSLNTSFDDDNCEIGTTMPIANPYLGDL